MKTFAFSPEAFARARTLADGFASRLHRPAMHRAANPRAELAGDGSAEVYIYDAIGGWWGGLTADSFRQQLESLKGAKRLNIFVNSPGGDVFEAKAMLSQLERFDAQKVLYVDGLIASAATFLAMGADRIVTAPHGTWMVHNAWGLAAGDAQAMRDYAELLDLVSADIAGVYARRTKQPLEKLQELMDAETWMNAEQALELGFTDKVATFRDDTAPAEPAPEDTAAAAQLRQTVGLLEATRAQVAAFEAHRTAAATRSRVRSTRGS
jgi:ATP-dependent protease ClpP protease subunit